MVPRSGLGGTHYVCAVWLLASLVVSGLGISALVGVT